jgi:hypothetical protein
MEVTYFFTLEQWVDSFPEFAGTTEGQFELWYCFAYELFQGFCGAKTEKARELLLKYATSHIAEISCSAENGAQVKEVKTMNATVKYQAQDYDPDRFTLHRTGYGQLLLDYANMCYGGAYIEPWRQGGCNYHYAY